MATGWISIHRELQNCWVADDKPYNYMSAWVDILLMASHKDTKILFDGKLIDVKRGSFITSILKLSNRWGWSRTKTKHFLDMLVSDSMIDYKSDNKKTSINVLNYSKFQDFSDDAEQQKDNESASEEHQKDNRETSEKHQKDTINNDKQCNNNVNNEKQYIYSDVPELENSLLEFEKMRKKIKKPIASKTTVTRLMNKLNKLAGNDIALKVAIVNQSVDHCWKDFYELKDSTVLEKEVSNENKGSGRE